MDLIQGGHSIIIQKKNQTSVHELPKREGKSWFVAPFFQWQIQEPM